MGNRRIYSPGIFHVTQIEKHAGIPEVWHLVGSFETNSIKTKYDDREYRLRVAPDSYWEGVTCVQFRISDIYESESVQRVTRRHIYGSGKWYVSLTGDGDTRFTPAHLSTSPEEDPAHLEPQGSRRTSTLPATAEEAAEQQAVDERFKVLKKQLASGVAPGEFRISIRIRGDKRTLLTKKGLEITLIGYDPPPHYAPQGEFQLSSEDGASLVLQNVRLRKNDSWSGRLAVSASLVEPAVFTKILRKSETEYEKWIERKKADAKAVLEQEIAALDPTKFPTLTFELGVNPKDQQEQWEAHKDGKIFVLCRKDSGWHAVDEGEVRTCIVRELVPDRVFLVAKFRFEEYGGDISAIAGGVTYARSRFID